MNYFETNLEEISRSTQLLAQIFEYQVFRKDESFCFVAHSGSNLKVIQCPNVAIIFKLISFFHCFLFIRADLSKFAMSH